MDPRPTDPEIRPGGRGADDDLPSVAWPTEGDERTAALVPIVLDAAADDDIVVVEDMGDEQGSSALRRRAQRLADLLERARKAAGEDVGDVVDGILADLPGGLPEQPRQRLTERLCDVMHDWGADSFAALYLMESIARVIERTAPPQSSGDLDAIAEHFEAAERLRHLATVDRREALALSVQQLKQLIRQVRQSRDQSVMLEETSVNACSELNRSEHALIELRAEVGGMLSQLVEIGHLDADERDQVLADDQPVQQRFALAAQAVRAACSGTTARRDLQHRVEMLQKHLDQAQSRVAELEAADGSNGTLAAPMAGDLQQQQDELDRRRQALAEAEADVAQRRVALESDLESLVEERATFEADAMRASEELERREQRLEVRLRSIADQEGALERRREETATITKKSEADLQDFGTRLQSLRAELDASRERAGQMQAALREQLEAVEEHRLQVDREFEEARLAWADREVQLQDERDEAAAAAKRHGATVGILMGATGTLGGVLAELGEVAEHLEQTGEHDPALTVAIADLRAASELGSAGDAGVGQELAGLVQSAAAGLAQRLPLLLRSAVGSDALHALEARQQAAAASVAELEAALAEESAAAMQAGDRIAELEDALAVTEQQLTGREQELDRFAAEREAEQRDWADERQRFSADVSYHDQRRQALEQEVAEARHDARDLAAQLEQIQQATGRITRRDARTAAALLRLIDSLIATVGEVERQRTPPPAHLAAVRDLERLRQRAAVEGDQTPRWEAADIDDVAGTAALVVEQLDGLRHRLADELQAETVERELLAEQQRAGQAAADQLRRQVQEAEQAGARLERQLTERRRQEESQSAQLADREAQLAQQQTHLAGLEVDLSETQARLAASDARVVELAGLPATVAALNERLEHSGRRIDRAWQLTRRLADAVQGLGRDIGSCLGEAGVGSGPASRRLTRSTERFDRLDLDDVDSIDAVAAAAEVLCGQIGKQVDALVRQVALAEVAEHDRQIQAAASEQELADLRQAFAVQAEQLSGLQERADRLPALEEQVRALAGERDERDRRLAEQEQDQAGHQRAWQAELDGARAAAAELQQLLQQERAQLQEQVLDLQRRLQATQEQQEHTVAGLEAEQAAWQVRQQEWDQRLAERDRSVQELQQVCDQLRREHREVSGLQGRIETLDRKLQEANHALAAARHAAGKADGRDGQVDHLQKQRSGLERRLADLEHQLTLEQARSSSLEQQHQRLQQQHRQRLSQARSDITELETALAEERSARHDQHRQAAQRRRAGATDG